jgi:bleomycin hydrolase
MKRKHDTDHISDDFITDCQTEFNQDDTNIISKNIINTVGTMFPTINTSRVNNISHIFETSLKKKTTKATNQGASGRCWMFAGLNVFRHCLIDTLNLDNFEFSAVYLFFWDKLERSNTYLKWFIEHPSFKFDDRDTEYMLGCYMNDGGWWNTFANLVNKYGVIPKDAMKETFLSEDSDSMNKIISDKLEQTVYYIFTNRNKLNKKELDKIREKTVKEIYFILVKFLGEPPKKFNWIFKNHDEEVASMKNITPKAFLNMIIPELDLNEKFINLAHIPIPNIKLYNSYTIKYTNNVAEGKNCTLFTVPISDLSRYAMKSIDSGIPVWFVGDVSKCFNWIHSTLDDQMVDNKVIGEDKYNYDKSARILMKNVQGNHAMCLTGFTLDKNGIPESWQVENSWGSMDSEESGQDGFLYMSNTWFEKYVLQIVVHKNLLSRTIKKKLCNPSLYIYPWESVAPATRTNGQGVPKNYKKLKN